MKAFVDTEINRVVQIMTFTKERGVARLQEMHIRERTVTQDEANIATGTESFVRTREVTSTTSSSNQSGTTATEGVLTVQREDMLGPFVGHFANSLSAEKRQFYEQKLDRILDLEFANMKDVAARKKAADEEEARLRREEADRKKAVDEEEAEFRRTKRQREEEEAAAAKKLKIDLLDENERVNIQQATRLELLEAKVVADLAKFGNAKAALASLLHTETFTTFATMAGVRGDTVHIKGSKPLHWDMPCKYLQQYITFLALKSGDDCMMMLMDMKGNAALLRSISNVRTQLKAAFETYVASLPVPPGAAPPPPPPPPLPPHAPQVHEEEVAVLPAQPLGMSNTEAVAANNPAPPPAVPPGPDNAPAAAVVGPSPSGNTADTQSGMPNPAPPPAVPPAPDNAPAAAVVGPSTSGNTTDTQSGIPEGLKEMVQKILAIPMLPKLDYTDLDRIFVAAQLFQVHFYDHIWLSGKDTLLLTYMIEATWKDDRLDIGLLFNILSQTADVFKPLPHCPAFLDGLLLIVKKFYPQNDAIYRVRHSGSGQSVAVYMAVKPLDKLMRVACVLAPIFGMRDTTAGREAWNAILSVEWVQDNAPATSSPPRSYTTPNPAVPPPPVIPAEQQAVVRSICAIADLKPRLTEEHVQEIFRQTPSSVTPFLQSAFLSNHIRCNVKCEKNGFVDIRKLISKLPASNLSYQDEFLIGVANVGANLLGCDRVQGVLNPSNSKWKHYVLPGSALQVMNIACVLNPIYTLRKSISGAAWQSTLALL